MQKYNGSENRLNALVWQSGQTFVVRIMLAAHSPHNTIKYFLIRGQLELDRSPNSALSWQYDMA